VISAGNFGPKLSGKTTLNKELSREYWLGKGIPSLVLDPFEEDWGSHAWVTSDMEHFKHVIFEKEWCLVIIEEASSTIAREKEFMPIFTRLRHQHHRLIVSGHSGADLLPGMRQNLDTVYLFRQPPSIAEYWAETFAQREIMEACELGKYEFLEVHSFKLPQKRRLTLR
jgi:hypothetical protein